MQVTETCVSLETVKCGLTRVRLLLAAAAHGRASPSHSLLSFAKPLPGRTASPSSLCTHRALGNYLSLRRHPLHASHYSNGSLQQPAR